MKKIKQGIEILKELGMPDKQQNERSALTLLALADLGKNKAWSKAKKRLIRIHDILVFVKEEYDKNYAENTRETIRRQTVHQFEQAGIAERNSDNPSRPTNSPKNVYNLSDVALTTIMKFGSSDWNQALKKFLRIQGKLIDRYQRRKISSKLALKTDSGKEVLLSPGKHNELQIQIVKVFRSHFVPKAKILYLGDTAQKMLHVDKIMLKKLKIPITQHDKLPDIVLYERKRNYLLLIEAVTAHGPMSPKRYEELEAVLKTCPAIRIYISAFLYFKEFKRHINDIAWETEVWIAEAPEHMIHFNGEKFIIPLK